jgi:hypothetical protein
MDHGRGPWTGTPTDRAYRNVGRLVFAGAVLGLGAASFGAAGQQPPVPGEPFTASKPCDNDLIMAVEGGYRQQPHLADPAVARLFPKAPVPEMMRRLDAFHQLLVGSYPRPLGQEARWWHALGVGTFAPGVDVVRLSQTSQYCYYVCGQPAGSRAVGFFCDNGTRVEIVGNDLGRLRSDTAPLGRSIDGRPVLMISPVIGSWKGHDVHAEHESLQRRHVLITRQGESPYTPVTRRQWLAHQQARVGPYYDGMLAGLKQMPWISNPDVIANLTKARAAALDHFAQELARSQAAKLLDTPAIILGDTLDPATPIFAPPGASRPLLLVTANPAYMRRNLPPQVPQFISLTWSWDQGDTSLGGGIQGVRFKRIFEADFPVDKLQALLDR